MPKAILEFNLDDCNDHDEFELVTNARKYYSILCELDQYMKNKIKYNTEDTPPLFAETIQMVRDEFYKLLEEKNLDLYI